MPVVNAAMHKQYIQAIVDAACETADTIVGAREWNTVEDATAMHELIFWDMIARKLPDLSAPELLAVLDISTRRRVSRTG